MTSEEEHKAAIEMNDRELLERAAKAAGYTVKGEGVDIADAFTCLVVNAGHGTRRFRWNPLTDDGDALRLAVKLRLGLEWESDAVVWCGGCGEMDVARDVYAATRRAIVRAAAALADSEPT